MGASPASGLRERIRKTVRPLSRNGSRSSATTLHRISIPLKHCNNSSDSAGSRTFDNHANKSRCEGFLASVPRFFPRPYHVIASGLRIDRHPNPVCRNPSTVHPPSRNIHPFTGRLLASIARILVCIRRGRDRRCIAWLRKDSAENAAHQKTAKDIRRRIAAAMMVVVVCCTRRGTIVMTATAIRPGVTGERIGKKQCPANRCSYQSVFHLDPPNWDMQ